MVTNVNLFRRLEKKSSLFLLLFLQSVYWCEKTSVTYRKKFVFLHRIRTRTGNVRLEPSRPATTRMCRPARSKCQYREGGRQLPSLYIADLPIGNKGFHRPRGRIKYDTMTRTFQHHWLRLRRSHRHGTCYFLRYKCVLAR